MADKKTVLRPIACGGVGGEICAVDSEDDKIVRIRPFDYTTSYTEEELEPARWSFEAGGKEFKADLESVPNIFGLAYKERVYSKNRVKYPLKRVDWDPNGERHPENRGRSKFERISWDEALDIMESEIKRVIKTYGPLSVLCIGEDGHRESKDLQSGGGMHAQLMDKLGGYTRETRTPDSVEGWYWGGKHVWGSGCNKGLGLPAMPQLGYNSWNTTMDVSQNAEVIDFCAADWELTQNYAGQFFSKLLRYWESIGKQFIVVDPFCNYTCVDHKSMKWIPILPNTDAALDFAVMYMWIKEGTYDKEYVETHTVGFEKVKAYIMGEEDGIPKDPKWASERTGIPVWTIKAYARVTGKKVTAYCHYSSGSIKGPYSHEPGRTEPYKLGMQGFGKPGVQIIYMNNIDIAKPAIARSTTAPFAMSNKCRMFYPTKQSLPRTMIATAIREGAAKWWGSPCIVYVETAEQFIEYNYPAPKDAEVAAGSDAAHQPEWMKDQESIENGAGAKEQTGINYGGTKCHMLWSEKPCNQACWNAGFSFQDAIRSPEVETYVTNHQWLENDSLFADLVLPVTTCCEETDDVGGDSIVSMKVHALQDPCCPPVGESMSDYHIACELGERFGVREQLDLGMTDDEWMEYAYQNSRLPEEISWEELKEKKYYFPKLDPDWKQVPPGMRMFADDPEKYPLDTPSGKLEFYSEALAEHFPDDKERGPIAKWVTGGPASEGWWHDESLWGERCKKYPLLADVSPARWRVHVQGDDIGWFREIETGKVRGFDGYLYEPVWMTPEDAKARGIEAGDICKVYNDRGTVLCAARISERITPGSIYVAKGARVDPIAPHIDRGGDMNLISPEHGVSYHCKGFVVTGYLVEVEKLSMAEYNEMKEKYPDNWNRPYDPAIGRVYDSWVVSE